MAIDTAGYRASFDLLRGDLLEVWEFIEPVSEHAKVYSHRLYWLLLRACTDFESLAKDLLVDQGYQKPPDKMNVLDYRRLESTYHLEPVEVRLHFWRPRRLPVFPFRRWSSAQPPLRWYADYNAVKHNRQREFARANLLTVVTAAAGLLTLVAKASDFNWDASSLAWDESQFTFCYPSFSVHGPA